MSIKSNPISRAIVRNLRADPGVVETLAALMAVADRINANSGSPNFTADEHGTLLQVIYRARGEA